MKLFGSIALAMALAVIAALVPAAASAQTITKLEGTAGCVSDPASSLPEGTCIEAKGIDDATDVAVSPDGKFVYAAATSSNSIAVFSRNEDTGALTQLAGQDGCIAHSGTPITGCASANGLEGPSALAMSPDGQNIYVTTFKLDPDASPTPVIQGTLTTFTRNETTGALDQTGCVVGGVPSAIVPISPPSGCTTAMFPQNPALLGSVPLGTASDVEVSPDGSSVVTSSFLTGSVVNWNRNAGSGALTPRECFGSSSAIFPTNGNPLPLYDVCDDGLLPPGTDTGGEAAGLGYPLDVEFAPEGDRLYAAALGLEQPATEVGGIEIVPAADEPGSVALFNRDGGGALTQPASPNGCIDDSRDPVQPDTTCAHRTALLNPYRVNVSPDGENVYVGTLNVFPPDGIAGPGPGELSQFNADLTQLDPPCLQQLGLPSGDLQPTTGCSLLSFGLILPSDVAFTPDGATAHIASLFHSVGTYSRNADTGALAQAAPPGGCSIDPRNLIPGTELLAQLCQNAVPLNAPTSIELSPDGESAYVTSGGFLTGNPNFGPSLAEAGIESDDAITVFGPTPPAEPPVEPPAEDKTPPALTVKAKKKQRAGKAVKVRVSCDEACTVKATGKAKPKGGARGNLRATQAELEADEQTKLKLKPSRRLAKQLRGARKGKATVVLNATDAAGNLSSARAKVKLKGKRKKR
jgi:hypothetical protein